MKMETDPEAEREASRLKGIAETKFKNSNLKSALKHAKKAQRLAPSLEGLSSMVTAFKILRVASKSKEWYQILQVEPFSHINTIKKQYKKLALILHPDKNPHSGSEEAFKLVGEAFRVLSDKVRRKEYDMRFRIKIQDEKVALDDNDDGFTGKETFWTACSRCRLLHQFERKYLDQILVCPGCKMSFEAVEAKESNAVRVFRSGRLSEKMGSADLKMKMGNVGLKRKTVSGDTKMKGSGGSGVDGESGDSRKEMGGGRGDWGGGRLRRRTSSVGEVLARSKPKLVEDREESMTLAEMQLEAKRRANQAKLKFKLKEKEMEKRGKKEKKREKEIERHRASKNKDLEVEGQQAAERIVDLENENGVLAKKIVNLRTKKRRTVKKTEDLQIVRQETLKKSVDLVIERHKTSKTKDLEIMAVEDSDFYDFDRDRMERSFKKGQVWAIYDDDDGMPRHYGLIDEVSVNPFEVKISWLDLRSNGDEGLICWEKQGFHVSCGRFKVSRKTSIDSLNIFSHIVECERAAREVYRIFPTKGSVWALYNEAALGIEGSNLSARDRRSYDIVVLLTTYSEMHGLSMAYLKKVDGFKAVFKRREIGCHAIRWLEKDDVRLFSHQIPARKVTGDEIPDSLKDCWELDPASLPSDLLTIGWGS